MVPVTGVIDIIEPTRARQNASTALGGALGTSRPAQCTNSGWWIAATFGCARSRLLSEFSP